ncbi:hypothetical protein [Mucilaginibacter auburnensis]|uniref:Lipoprotein n=1 Tax=Mucilaginibacter auburnensis TaxID=1457233 RepID=A0A2H9VQC0_9SPHI|nr:hypothetical protein [Mucilaginibacter auburnensis]PJJ80516.1 hypothetical protein CLV57_3667 [Mucilaginibacter auburnensis]
MKTFKKSIALLFAGVALFTACKDKTVSPKSDLTTCTGCQFLFTESADVQVPGYTLKSGEYRVFWSEVKKGPLTQKTFIKAPMVTNSFTIGKAGIQDGNVLVLDICPSCNMVEMMPVDGQITGINTTPGLPADKAKWLIEAKIIRVPYAFSNLRDTVHIKQYFTANFVNN